MKSTQPISVPASVIGGRNPAVGSSGSSIVAGSSAVKVQAMALDSRLYVPSMFTMRLLSGRISILTLKYWPPSRGTVQSQKPTSVNASVESAKFMLSVSTTNASCTAAVAVSLFQKSIR